MARNIRQRNIDIMQIGSGLNDDALERVIKARRDKYNLLTEDERKILVAVVNKMVTKLCEIKSRPGVDFNQQKDIINKVKGQLNVIFTTSEESAVLKPDKLNMDMEAFTESIYHLIKRPETCGTSKGKSDTGDKKDGKKDEKKDDVKKDLILTALKSFKTLKSQHNVLLIVDNSVKNDKDAVVKVTDAILREICTSNKGDAVASSSAPAGEGENAGAAATGATGAGATGATGTTGAAATGATGAKTRRPAEKMIKKLFYLEQNNNIADSLGSGYKIEERAKLNDINKVPAGADINLIIHIAGASKQSFDVESLLFSEALTSNKSTPYIFTRTSDNKYDCEQFNVLEKSNIRSLLQSLKALINVHEANQTNRPDWMFAQNHDKEVERIRLAFQRTSSINPDSVDYILKYKFNLKLTPQQEEAVKLQFNIAENTLKLQTQITNEKHKKSLAAFIVNNTDDVATRLRKESLWLDLSVIPSKVNMVVISPTLDYGLFDGLMKLLEFSSHKLAKLYIHKDAFDSQEIVDLKLKSSSIEIITYSKGGLYELLQNDTDVNLVVNFSRGQTSHYLSHIMMYEHIIKNYFYPPGYFYINIDNTIAFDVSYDITYKSLQDKIEDAVRFYDLLVKVIKDRRNVKDKESSKKFNDYIDDLETQIVTFLNTLTTVPPKNDFVQFKNVYSLQDITSEQQNKNTIETIKSSIKENKESEFYTVISSLKNEQDDVNISKLKSVQNLPQNINVLLINYNNSKKDFISLVKDLISNNTVNTLYVQKSDYNDEVTNVFSQSSTIAYSNIYEIFEKMTMTPKSNTNIDVIINASPNGNLSISQKVTTVGVLSDPNNVYFGIQGENDLTIIDKKDTIDSVVYDSVTVSNIIDILKEYGRLSIVSKLGSDLVEFNRVVEKLSKVPDPDLSFFLSRTSAQPVKPKLFDDDLQALTTLLQQKENQKLSDFLKENFDMFRTVLKTLPQNNNILVLDFEDAFSTFESAIKTVSVVLKGIERDVVKAYYNVDTIKTKLWEYLNIPGSYSANDSLTSFSSFSNLFEKTSNSKEQFKLIVKGNTTISPQLALFLSMLIKRGENPVLFMFDFDQQQIVLKPSDEILKTLKFSNEQVDEIYMSFNVIEAIKSKLLSLNDNGNNFWEGKFNREQYVNDLTEFNGIVQTFNINEKNKAAFQQVIDEYSDALLTFDLYSKIDDKDHILTQLSDVIEDPSKLESFDDKDKIKTFINKLYTTFAKENDLANPELLKYRSVVGELLDKDYILKTKGVKTEEQHNKKSLDYYITRTYIDNGLKKYREGLNSILKDNTSLVYQKLTVLRVLLANIYKVKYGTKDVLTGRDEKTRMKFKRFIVPEPNNETTPQEAYQVDVTIKMLRTTINTKHSHIYNMIMSNIQSKSKISDEKQKILNDDLLIDDIIRFMFVDVNKNDKLITNKFFTEIYNTVYNNVSVLIKDLPDVWRNKWSWLPFLKDKKGDVSKKLFSLYFFDTHIIPVFVEFNKLTLSFGAFQPVDCNVDKMKLNLRSCENPIQAFKPTPSLLISPILPNSINENDFQDLKEFAINYVTNYGMPINLEGNTVAVVPGSVSSISTTSSDPNVSEGASSLPGPSDDASSVIGVNSPASSTPDASVASSIIGVNSLANSSSDASVTSSSQAGGQMNIDTINKNISLATTLKSLAIQEVYHYDKLIRIEQRKSQKIKSSEDAKQVEKMNIEASIPELELKKRTAIQNVNILSRVITHFDLLKKLNADESQKTINDINLYNQRVSAEFVKDYHDPDKNNKSSNLVYGSDISGFEEWFKEANDRFKNKLPEVYNVENIKNSYCNDGLEFIAEELFEIIKGDSTDKGVNFLITDDVFLSLTSIIAELKVIFPNLTGDFHQLLKMIAEVKDKLKNPVIANLYQLDPDFQKSIIENQSWMQLLLHLNNPVEIQQLVQMYDKLYENKINEILNEYEKVCKKIREAETYKHEQAYIDEIIKKKKGQSGGGDDVDEVDDADAVKPPPVPARESDPPVTIIEESPTREPTTEESPTREPTTEEPTTEEPTTKETSTEEPATKETSTEEPSTKETSTEEPTPEETSTEEPSTEEPSTKETSTEEPTPEETSTEETSKSNVNVSPSENVEATEATSTNNSTPSVLMQSPNIKSTLLPSDPEKPKSTLVRPSKDIAYDELAALEGTNLIHMLKYLKLKKKKEDERRYKDDLIKLFEKQKSDDITIFVKSSNDVSPIKQGFMFGGGLFTSFFKPKSTETTQVASTGKLIPDFKKATVENNITPNLRRDKDIDFNEGVQLIFGDDPELVRLLIAYNNKYKDVYLEAPTNDVDILELLVNVVNQYPLFTQYFGKIDKSQLPFVIQSIKDNVRPAINDVIKTSNYDTSRISKQIKEQPLKLSSDIEIKHKSFLDIPEDNTQNDIISASKTSNTDTRNEETVFQKSQISMASVVNNNKEDQKPINSIAEKISGIIGNVGFSAASSGGTTNKDLPNLTQTHLYIQEILTDLDGFYKKMQRKHGRWGDELNSMLNQGEVPLKVQINTHVNLLGSGKLLEIERRKVSIQLLYLMKKFARAIGDKSIVNYAIFKDYFFQDKRKEIRALLDYLQTFVYVKDDLFIAKFTDDEKAKAKALQLRETYNKIEKTFNEFLQSFHIMNESFYKGLSELLEDTITDSSTIYMRDKERSKIVILKRDLLANMQYLPKKIKSFYTLNYPVTEMFDMQFLLMYIIKFVKILSFSFSMNMATNIFIQKYENVVYDKKINPPSLTSFMFIFLGFDLFFTIFLFILLGLCGFLFKTENNTFPIDGYLYKKFAVDYIISTIIIMVLGILIGSVIKQKKYFRYKTEGERGIRAFEDIMKMTATVVTIAPMFMLLS
jgi:hypothetical protein